MLIDLIARPAKPFGQARASKANEIRFNDFTKYHPCFSPPSASRLTTVPFAPDLHHYVAAMCVPTFGYAKAGCDESPNPAER